MSQVTTNSFPYPIDLVYLWCDGSDPKFIEEKNKRFQEVHPEYSEDNVGDIRYVQYDELKYSLRSAEMYAPWIRHIFIVTNKQTPSWLKEHPKITIVDHTEIIPQELLPVFSSVCIEMFLDKIPGLAEHFLYANDDMLFNRPVSPLDFFTQESKPIVWLKKCHMTSQRAQKLLTNKENNWHKTVVRAWDLFCKKYNKTITFASPAHSIDAYTKTLFQNTLLNFPQLESCNLSPFRTGNEISRVLFSYEMHYTFQAPLQHNPKTNFWARCTNLFFPKKVYAVTRHNIQKLMRDIQIFKPLTFCINDLNSSNARLCIKYLNSRFPKKASWEK